MSYFIYKEMSKHLSKAQLMFWLDLGMILEGLGEEKRFTLGMI